jgi:hypothetical protein
LVLVETKITTMEEERITSESSTALTTIKKGFLIDLENKSLK